MKNRKQMKKENHGYKKEKELINSRDTFLWLLHIHFNSKSLQLTIPSTPFLDMVDHEEAFVDYSEVSSFNPSSQLFS